MGSTPIGHPTSPRNAIALAVPLGILPGSMNPHRRRDMPETRPIDPNEDPVCGMRVDPDAARARGLTLTHDGREYLFCGKGCFLEFRDHPEPFLDPRRRPSRSRRSAL